LEFGAWNLPDKTFTSSPPFRMRPYPVAREPVAKHLLIVSFDSGIWGLELGIWSLESTL